MRPAPAQREAIEHQRHENAQKLQDSLRASKGEIQQLEATVIALRELLEVKAYGASVKSELKSKANAKKKMEAVAELEAASMESLLEGVGMKDRLRIMELLLGLSQKMASTESLDEALATFIEVAMAELNAERGTLFLNDPTTNELYSRVAQGGYHREIRILNTTGVTGHVFTTGESIIVDDAYNNPHFSKSVDDESGFVTKAMLCVPVLTAKNEVMGVVDLLNKRDGKFTRRDLELLVAMTRQGTLALQSAQYIERMKRLRAQELEFMDIVSTVTSDIKIGSLLYKVMGEATRMLDAERSTLFLNDEKTGELWSELGQGLSAMQIRLPNTEGIAGAVFTEPLYNHSAPPGTMADGITESRPHACAGG